MIPPAAMIGTLNHRGHVLRVLEAAALAALDDQPVDPGLDRFQRALQGGHDVEHGESGRLEIGGVTGRVAGRGRDEPHALVDHELDDVGVPHEGLGDVDAERLVGEVPHLADLLPHRVQLARRRLDDAESAGVGDGRGQLGPSDPSHRGLHDRVLDPEQFGDTVDDGGHGPGAYGHSPFSGPFAAL